LNYFLPRNASDRLLPLDLEAIAMSLTLQPIPTRSSETFSAEEVVEFGLLLPKNRAMALIDLAKQRRQTVAQLLRNLIDETLTTEA
jgi:hypothetical protein